MTDHSSDKLQAHLETMGLLTAGVVHEFNNLLAIVEGYSYILQQRIGPAPMLQDKVSAILSATHHGTELTQLLMDFSNPAAGPQSCDLVAVVQQNKVLLRTMLGSRIEISLELPASAVMIGYSANKLTEELIRLAAQIGQTMTEAGSMTVSLDVTSNEAVLFLTHHETGFYVSKNFQLLAESRLQDKTILIVDDETALLPVLEHQLQNMGLKVLKAANADSALLLQKDYPDVIDFLLTDIVMPGVDGMQLAEMMTDNRPRMGVVYMTGYNNRTIDLPDHSLIVPKPLRNEDLSEALQQVEEA